MPKSKVKITSDFGCKGIDAGTNGSIMKSGKFLFSQRSFKIWTTFSEADCTISFKAY